MLMTETIELLHGDGRQKCVAERARLRQKDDKLEVTWRAIKRL
jgi:hypothetical protein